VASHAKDVALRRDFVIGFADHNSDKLLRPDQESSHFLDDVSVHNGRLI